MCIPLGSIVGGLAAFLTFFVAHWLGMSETWVFWTGMAVGTGVAAVWPIDTHS